MQPTDIDRLRYLIRMLTPPNPSDSEDNVTQNLKWYEQQRAQREEKRILNNAIRDVQYMTVDQQLNWAKENRELAGSVIRHLRAEVQLEVILHDERENEKEDEEFKRIEAAQRSLKKDVHGFLRSILPPRRRVPARLVLSTAA